MKKILILLFLFVLNSYGYGQNDLTKKDTLPSEERSLPTEIRNKLFIKAFSNIITGKLKTSIGNFASANVNDASLTFGISSISEGGNALVFSLSAGAGDGVASLFNNTYAAPKIELGVQYNWLSKPIFSKNLLIINTEDKKKYLQKLDEINKLFDIESANARLKHGDNYYDKLLKKSEDLKTEIDIVLKQSEVEITEIEALRVLLIEKIKSLYNIELLFDKVSAEEREKLGKEKDRLNSEIMIIKTKIEEHSTIKEDLLKKSKVLKTQSDTLESEKGKLYKTQREKLSEQISKLKLSLSALQKEIASEKDDNKKREMKYERTKLESQIELLETKKDFLPKNALEEINQLTRDRKMAIQKLDSTMKYRGLKGAWLSFSANAVHNAFKLFVPGEPYENQVQDKKRFNLEAKVQVSYYDWNDFSNATFYCGGVSFILGDNFSSLKDKELSEVSNYGLNPGQRTTTKKYKVYTGDYSETLLGEGNFFADGYHFVYNNSAAIHWLFDLKAKHKEKRTFGVGAGILLSYKNEEGNAKVNSELYAELYDLDNGKNSELSFWERYDIGIRFSFPINFK